MYFEEKEKFNKNELFPLLKVFSCMFRANTIFQMPNQPNIFNGKSSLYIYFLEKYAFRAVQAVKILAQSTHTLFVSNIL